MVSRHGPAVLRIANQFSLCQDDALDAYQRAFEIYLRKLGSVDPATEGAWMRVVVKHEAMAIRARAAGVGRPRRRRLRRQRPRPAARGRRRGRRRRARRSLGRGAARAQARRGAGAAPEGAKGSPTTRSAAASAGPTRRSTARMTEGRARFLKAFSGIESGEACDEYADAISALAAGTASSADVVSIRPHLRHCATCRATVRDMRFSRGRRFALAMPFGWLARLLSRSDVSTSVYAASTGGGRLGPAAALVGLCLSGVGAGAACVMTGALPAPPIIEQLENRPEKRAEPKQRARAAAQDADTRAGAHRAAHADRRPARRRHRDGHGDTEGRAEAGQEEDHAPAPHDHQEGQGGGDRRPPGVRLRARRHGDRPGDELGPGRVVGRRGLRRRRRGRGGRGLQPPAEDREDGRASAASRR